MTAIVRWHAPIYGIDGLTLGERLRRVRKRKGLQAQHVASSAEIRPEQITRWENDHTIPELPSFASLADFYGIPMNVLFWGPLPDDEGKP